MKKPITVWLLTHFLYFQASILVVGFGGLDAYTPPTGARRPPPCRLWSMESKPAARSQGKPSTDRSLSSRGGNKEIAKLKPPNPSFTAPTLCLLLFPACYSIANSHQKKFVLSNKSRCQFIKEKLVISFKELSKTLECSIETLSYIWDSCFAYLVL